MPSPEPSSSAGRTAAHLFLTGPAWDLAFVINAPWVLFAVAHVLFLQGLMPDVDNFRHYYITLPHRFVTIFLVFLDRDQFARRPRTFVALPIGFTLLFLAAGSLGTGVILGTSAFLCIYTMDIIWNAYHFAAQHAGITRIYSRKAGGGRPDLEKGLLVPAIAYTLLTTTNWMLVDGSIRWLFVALDAAAGAAFLTLIALELRARVPSLPKLLYLVSVTLLYGGILALPYLGLGGLRLGSTLR